MAQPLDRYVGTGDTLQRLQAHAARLLRLQAHVDAALPPYLAGLCRVANLKEDVLVLHAGNGAVAAKLRQAAPRLINALAAHGIILSAVKVATRPPETRPTRPEPAVRSVSHDTCDGLQDLATHLPEDDPLRQALERFVQHSRTREE
ncbi:DUF721 domain-containing protein [Nitrogeniibacter mangrovi]|uniref:DUF721 domain-containing protein n=1 Tax=Nitrogeniibacter mangrovi TaxID=2016596 RepID=A0A6C1B230_9RHOO|nr:DUF721 domain-containing protein [Nitrogeniibacter mangrovi]QID17039.1 DUF721 domain-containing protein [Nitrogeniibacter mangrovi]